MFNGLNSAGRLDIDLIASDSEDEEICGDTSSFTRQFSRAIIC
jgi:hypothetical protein